VVYKNQNMVSVYANRYKTEWTNTDLRIRFGEIMFSAPGKHLVIEERVGVTMTWLTAKELRDDLNLLVAKYEEANGEIIDGVVISTRPKATPSAEDEVLEPLDDLSSEEGPPET